MKKIKNFLKNIAKKYCFDKKFNSIVSCLVEIPILIVGWVTKNYTLMIGGCFLWAVINFIFQRIGQKIYMKKHKNNFENLMKNFIVDGNNIEKGGNIGNV